MTSPKQAFPGFHSFPSIQCYKFIIVCNVETCVQSMCRSKHRNTSQLQYPFRSTWVFSVHLTYTHLKLPFPFPCLCGHSNIPENVWFRITPGSVPLEFEPWACAPSEFPLAPRLYPRALRRKRGHLSTPSCCSARGKAGVGPGPKPRGNPMHSCILARRTTLVLGVIH